MTQKYDWKILKAQYMASDTIEVRDFLRQILGDSSALLGGNITRQTSGWREEKEALKDQVFEESKEETIENGKDNIVELTGLKQKLLNKLKFMIELPYQPSEMRHIYNIIKIELGEPINIVKNQNHDITVEELMQKLEAVPDPYKVNDPTLDKEGTIE